MIGLVVMLIAIGFASIYLHVYYLANAAGGELWWSAGETYLFIDVTSRGYRMSCVQYLEEVVMEYFGAPRLPSKNRFSVVVLHITPQAVGRYTQQIHLGSYDLFAGGIYARNLDNEVLVRWTGTHFEPATSAESREFQRNVNSLPSGAYFADVDGWSRRMGPPDGNYTIELGGKPITLVVKSGRMNGLTSVDLLRPDQAPKRIWYLDDEPRRVSKIEYERVFGND
jgi:hypothetical protein